MKKTLITMLALSGIAMAADINAPTNGADLVGLVSSTDTLLLNSVSVDFVVSSAVELAKVDGSSNKTASLTIDFGSTGSITTAAQFNVGQKANRTMTISAAYTEEQIAALSDGVVNTRTLVHTTGNTIWNVLNEAANGKLTFTISGLEDFDSQGILYEDGGKLYSTVSFDEGYGTPSYSNETTLAANSYALVIGNKDIKIAAVTPEPAAATLSLLALAGLAARRRRH